MTPSPVGSPAKSGLSALLFGGGTPSTAAAGAGAGGADVEGGEGGGVTGFLSRLGGGNGTPAPPPESDWTCGLSKAQRFQLFVALLIGAAVLMGLAVFVFLPMVVFVPSKFAMSFTIGSLMFFGSFMVLRGPRTVARQLLAPDRIVFTSAYAGSIVLTLYSTISLQSYIAVIISAAVQLLALAWYGISYLPGGTAGMQIFTKFVVSTAKALCLPALRSAANFCPGASRGT